MKTTDDSRINDLRDAVNNIDIRVVKLEDKIGMTRDGVIRATGFYEI